MEGRLAGLHRRHVEDSACQVCDGNRRRRHRVRDRSPAGSSLAGVLLTPHVFNPKPQSRKPASVNPQPDVSPCPLVRDGVDVLGGPVVPLHAGHDRHGSLGVRDHVVARPLLALGPGLVDGLALVQRTQDRTRVRTH
jgi:hypothetical protein